MSTLWTSRGLHGASHPPRHCCFTSSLLRHLTTVLHLITAQCFTSSLPAPPCHCCSTPPLLLHLTTPASPLSRCVPRCMSRSELYACAIPLIVPLPFTAAFCSYINVEHLGFTLGCQLDDWVVSMLFAATCEAHIDFLDDVMDQALSRSHCCPLHCCLTHIAAPLAQHTLSTHSVEFYYALSTHSAHIQ